MPKEVLGLLCELKYFEAGLDAIADRKPEIEGTLYFFADSLSIDISTASPVFREVKSLPSFSRLNL